MKKLTHKTRAQRKLESLGWIVGDVERCVGRGRLARRFDLFGLFDLLAIKDGRTLGLQVTVPDRAADHIYKMQAEYQRLRMCLAAGWLIELWAVRNNQTRDGSFALTRSFELGKRGAVLLYEGSDILE